LTFAAGLTWWAYEFGRRCFDEGYRRKHMDAKAQWLSDWREGKPLMSPKELSRLLVLEIILGSALLVTILASDGRLNWTKFAFGIGIVLISSCLTHFIALRSIKQTEEPTGAPPDGV
jgi:hypothetical protein